MEILVGVGVKLAATGIMAAIGEALGSKADGEGEHKGSATGAACGAVIGYEATDSALESIAKDPDTWARILDAYQCPF
ncbi:MAG: hypothetical protein K6A35_08360 [bacterium]|nr:hypothetical protein [bacterium]